MQRFKKILYVAEASPASHAAFTRAVTLANQNQAELTVVGVENIIPSERSGMSAKVREKVIAHRLRELEQEVNNTTDCDQPIQIKILDGRSYIEIIREVIRNKHDLVIKATEEPEGYLKTLFGTSDMNLIRKCPCPVWMINDKEHNHYQRILAAVDRDLEDPDTNNLLNRQILEMASSLAEAESAELHIVHAWNLECESFMRSAAADFPEVEVDQMIVDEKAACQCWLDELIESNCPSKTDQTGEDKTHVHLVRGDAQIEIPRLASELTVDVIVMGTLGRSGIPGFFMGNTAEQILKQTACSGLTMKPPGFVSPISPDSK